MSRIFFIHAGVLKDKKATCWDSENLEQKKAKFTGKDVERDGKIITARNAEVSVEFANTIIKAINE